MTHRDSLRELSVLSEISLDPSVDSLLRAFLMSTLTLTRLSIGWPEMDVSFFDSLPITLRQLEVGISDISFRQPVMDRLSSLDDRLQHLRIINFNGFNE
jgi:hypothetical protein